MAPTEPTRRRLLAGVVGALSSVALAGCSSDSDNPDDGADATTDDGEEETDDSDASNDSDDSNGGGTDDSDDENGDDDDENGDDDENSESGALDLREANAVGVEYDSDGQPYRFDVTLHHDDDGEDGYANWWQVERLDGTQLGRRELRHAHSQQPFTRSETIPVPEGVSCVVVRGHDQTHGYGGRAMLVNLATGTSQAVDQGPEPQSFDGGDCP